jgi:hypothetical protein
MLFVRPEVVLLSTFVALIDQAASQQSLVLDANIFEEE